MNKNEQHPARLGTEDRSEATTDIDLISVSQGLILLAREFGRSFEAFESHASELAPIVEAVVRCVASGNVVHLIGAGTSGRLAALDAAELPPTFGISPYVFRPHLAGGATAMTEAIEDAEDSIDEGARVGAQVNRGDVAIGVTASGRTPFVLAALDAARSQSAFTALIDCNAHYTGPVDCHVTLPTGPEPITGSTRLNAATAQKLALNAISTLAMVHLGKTYSNLMVCVQPNNAKLRQRLAQMLCEISGASTAQVKSALAASGNEGGVALAMLMRGWDVEQARAALGGSTLLRPIVEGSAGSSSDANPAR